MVNIFAREITDNLASLVKELDSVVAENKSSNMAGFLVLLTDDPDAAEEKLAALAKKENIKNIPLTIYDGVAGPPNYKIAKDADVTVHLWVKTKVKANHSFAKNELDAKAVKEVVADTKKIIE